MRVPRSTPRKIVFAVIAVILPLVLLEAGAWLVLKYALPRMRTGDPVVDKGYTVAVRTDYTANDFSADGRDYAQEAFGPYLHDARLKLPRRLIGPAAYQHYLNVNAYTLFPYTMFHFQRRYRSPVVNTNSLGYRARELADYQRDPRAKILILGGSAAFGFNVTSDRATIAAQLEDYLNARGGAVTCVNLAMGGYTTEQEVITLNRIGLRLNPAAVIAIDGGNDIIHQLSFRDGPWNFQPLAEAYYLRVQQDRLIAANSPGFHLKGLVRGLAPYSYVLALADRLTDRPRGEGPGKPPEVLIDACTLFPEVATADAIVETFVHNHRLMAEICRGRGIAYVAALQPMCGLWLGARWEGEQPHVITPQDPFHAIFQRLDAELEAAARRQGFAYVNLGKVLAASDNIYNFSDSIHLTDKSSAVIAQYLGNGILNTLEREKLRPPGTASPPPADAAAAAR